MLILCMVFYLNMFFGTLPIFLYIWRWLACLLSFIQYTNLSCPYMNESWVYGIWPCLSISIRLVDAPQCFLSGLWPLVWTDVTLCHICHILSRTAFLDKHFTTPKLIWIRTHNWKECWSVVFSKRRKGDKPPNVMKLSQRWNTIQIWPLPRLELRW